MTLKTIKILLVEDNPTDVLLTKELLFFDKQGGFDLTDADCLSKAITLLENDSFDVVLLDLTLPDSQGLDSVKNIIAVSPELPIVVLSGLKDEQLSIQAVQSGAQDYLIKGEGDGNLIKRSIYYSIERKRVDRELWEKTVYLDNILSSSPNLGIIALDINNTIKYFNQVAEELFDYKRETGIEKPIFDLLTKFKEFDDGFKTSVTIIRKDTTKNYSFELSKINNNQVIEAKISAISDNNGQHVGYVLMAQDITDRKSAEERLDYLAHFDSLTCLPNRILFFDRLSQTFAQANRNNSVFGIVYIDLDRFKYVNDTLGHNAGDQYLKEAAKRLKESIRNSDTVARMGGDEFTVILLNINTKEDAEMIVKKIFSTLTKPFKLEDREFSIEASMGICLYPSNGKDVTTLLINADTAMYYAKEIGRNNYQFFSSDMNDEFIERLILEKDIMKALERNEFIIYYQPQINLKTGKIVGIEALLRWNHKEFGIITPDKFIPLSEKKGIIDEIESWVILHSIEQYIGWKNDGFEVDHIAVNISGLQLKNQSMVNDIVSILEKTGLDPNILALELAEITIQQEETIVNTLEAISNLGIYLSIDDFGVGRSSLNHLIKFPFKKIKIDQSFIDKICHNDNAKAVTSAIIAMAHSLGLTVMAEGVEKSEQIELLRTMNCDEIQGYFISRPMPAAEFYSQYQAGIFSKLKDTLS